jgi:ATP-dependent RNA helicase RhlE
MKGIGPEPDRSWLFRSSVGGGCRRSGSGTNNRKNHHVTTRFSDLALIEPIQRALKSESYELPTPIQTQAIPHLLEGRDLLGIAQTGTGKTAAFGLPLLQRLFQDKTPAGPRMARSLILTPTRELAIQIAESLRTYGRHLHLRIALVYGGVGQRPQVDALARGVDILVATPGRLMDLMGQGHAKLDRVQIFVLDEADRMLDMGFIRDIRRIAATLPKQHQSLLFSATMPADIAQLADSMLRDPVKVTVTPAASTVERVEQRVFFVEQAQKRALLASMLGDSSIERALVFTRTKHGANKLVRQLAESRIGADAIHGDKTQGARQKALADFRSGRTRVLVATDIAARGIDIDGITHVINFEIPNMPESYVHRIGRTARAGATGIALSFCGSDERAYLRDIERTTRRTLTVVTDHAFAAPFAALPSEPATHRPTTHRQGTHGQGGHHGEPGAGERSGSGRGPGKGRRSFRRSGRTPNPHRKGAHAANAGRHGPHAA